LTRAWIRDEKTRERQNAPEPERITAEM
jgi:hypothetical protein